MATSKRFDSVMARKFHDINKKITHLTDLVWIIGFSVAMFYGTLFVLWLMK